MVYTRQTRLPVTGQGLITTYLLLWVLSFECPRRKHVYGRANNWLTSSSQSKPELSMVPIRISESCCSHSRPNNTRQAVFPLNTQGHSLSSPSPWRLQYLFVSTYQVRQFRDDISAVVVHVDRYRGYRRIWEKELKYTIGPLCNSLCGWKGGFKVGEKAWDTSSSMGMERGLSVVSLHSAIASDLVGLYLIDITLTSVCYIPRRRSRSLFTVKAAPVSTSWSI